jgi:REP element-mobilizing transposase RayT
LPHFDGGEIAQFVTFRVATGSRGESLSDPRLAEAIEGTLLHFDEERYRLHAWVIMPGHGHVLLTPRLGKRVSDIVHSWKSFASKKPTASSAGGDNSVRKITSTATSTTNLTSTPPSSTSTKTS